MCKTNGVNMETFAEFIGWKPVPILRVIVLVVMMTAVGFYAGTCYVRSHSNPWAILINELTGH